MAAQCKYNPVYHDDWAWSLAAQGATDKEIAAAFGIQVRTLHRWKKDHSSFLEALTTGKEAADSKIEKSLYKRAVGYEAKDVDQTLETDPVTGQVKITKQRVITKHIPPDTMAIMYWLNNRSKFTGKWTQQQKVELSGNVNMVDLSRMTDEQLAAIVELSEKETSKKDED